MEHKKTGFQAPPEAPGLCANKCGFFGSAATMNLCSKCHMELLMKKREHTEVLASSSIASAVAKDPNGIAQDLLLSSLNTDALENAKESPKRRCTTCKKRVGLTGFNCRCGDVFCAVHRYSDKHGCTYDYLSAARRAIANANPVIKAKKLEKF